LRAPWPGTEVGVNAAVLGMGRMGQGVALRLLEGGHAVTVWNRSPGKAGDVIAHGATEASAIAGAVAGAQVVITSLSNDDAVREVALGPGGVREQAGGALYADASTISPRLAEELTAAFEAFVAMPILGNPEAVRAGRAVYLLGGPPAAVERLEPVLPALTTTTHRYPRAAMAAHAKLASNLLLLDAIASLAESFAVARAGGLGDDDLRALLGESPMLAPGVKNRFEAVLSGQDPGWWTVALGAKDARLALEAAGAAGRQLPVTAAARDQYQQAADDGYAECDIATIGQRYRR
jgi:3-hydroxyisobutyrate dehydrogenase-like beta-hydroxyacid dehydrogenase